MVNECPKCGYVRQPDDIGPDYECPSCGIVYEKFIAAQDVPPLEYASEPRRMGWLVWVAGVALVLLVAVTALRGSSDSGQYGADGSALSDSARPGKVTDETFYAAVTHAEGYVLVDFWAPWCGPCRRMGPELDKLAQEYEGRMRVLKLNVDDNRTTAENFNIRSIPMLILFLDGKAVEHYRGFTPAAELSRRLGKHVQ